MCGSGQGRTTRRSGAGAPRTAAYARPESLPAYSSVKTPMMRLNAQAWRRRDTALLLSLLGALTWGGGGGGRGEPDRGQGRAWMFGPFEKPSEGNPVITLSPTSRFVSPMNDSSVQWEALATFNPTAVV